MLGRDSSVSVHRNTLVIRGTQAEVAEIRKVLTAIDRPPRRLLIEVRNSSGQSFSTQGLGYGVDTGNVRIGEAPPPGSQGQVRYLGAETRGQADTVQRVRALEGQPALIRAGESVPIYQGYQGVVGGGFVQGYEVQYRDAIQGFHALPRVNGDRVTVEIYQQADPYQPGGTFSRQDASTVVEGRLGEWMTLASTGGSDVDRQNAIGWHAQTHHTGDRNIELRVIPVD